MSKRSIPATDAFAEWRNDPAYLEAYEELDSEFELADALICARAAAHMTQEQVAEAMGTTQAAIARLESGGTMPSTRTLRRYAAATGTRLRIYFEPPVTSPRSPKKRPEHAE